MKKADLLNVTKSHIEWVASIFPDDKSRTIEQCYGYIQGVDTATGNKYHDEITEIWDKFYYSVLYGNMNK
jgi:hypothetical protein